MIQLKGTSTVIKNGAYILTFEANGTNRITVICYDLKATLKKYKDAGYVQFGSAEQYINEHFFALTKGFKVRTRNRRKVVIGNAMYFINKAIERNNITFEI